jgi:UDP-glucose 4-epimerase
MKSRGTLRVLVTGGAGFIGSHVVNRLVDRGDEVIVLDDLSTGLRDNVNPYAQLVVGSITDGQLVREAVAAVDACVHLAAIASVGRFNEDWAACHAVNQSAFVALLQFVARRPKGRIPLVYASSAAVYGNLTQLPICETAVARPLSGYGADKLGCESHARAAGEASGVATFGLRFFNVYGVRQRPGSRYAGVISIFVDRTLRGEPLNINGDGSQSRDFVHVDDAVQAVLAALARTSTTGPVCNVGTGVETSIVRLAKILSRIMRPSAVPVFLPARVGDISRSVADLTLAKHLLDYEAKVELHAGLKTLAW